MTVVVRGDLGTLRAFSNRLTKLSRFKDGALDAMAEEAQELADEPFERERDPYGRKWRKRKSGGSHGLLDKSGTMRGNQRVTKAGGQLRFANDTPYAGIHQGGSRKKTGRGSGIVARPFLPNKSKGIPNRWKTSLRKVIRLHLLGIL